MQDIDSKIYAAASKLSSNPEQLIEYTTMFIQLAKEICDATTLFVCAREGKFEVYPDIIDHNHDLTAAWIKKYWTPDRINDRAGIYCELAAYLERTTLALLGD